MDTPLSQAIQDYLKAIYELIEEGHGRASTNHIAARLGIAPASVTGMLQKMAASSPPLVEYQKHYGVALTEQGQRQALEVIRHHRLLELFLAETLGYSWDEVHPEADRLEHVLSEEMEERIAQLLGDPTHDPHGEPIPGRDLAPPAQSRRRLSDLRPGQTARIEWVDSADPDLLRYLGQLGFVPQALVSVLEFSTLDENLRVQVRNQPEAVVLGPRITRQVFMEEGGERLVKEPEKPL